MEISREIEINPRICHIPVNKAECEDARRKCSECPHKDICDYFWISELWTKENKLNGKDTLLGPLMPAFVKPDFRAGHVLTMTGKWDFCCFNVPKTKDVVVIGDIYVDDAARGMGLSKKILNYLMETYDRDIFAKCVRDSSAEAFWSHVGYQVDANIDNPNAEDMYEHRPGKRDLGWYRVTNQNKKAVKEDLW